MCKISIIVAVSNNNVIGKDNSLIWYLPADLRHFKKLTTNHHIIMGRKTFESIGKVLPKRTSVIVTRQKNYKKDNCIIVNSLSEAIEKSKYDKEIFIIGGESIYKASLNFADRIYLTKIHKKFEGDRFFPFFDKKIWKEVERIDHRSDKKNKYDYSFLIFEKNKKNFL